MEKRRVHQNIQLDQLLRQSRTIWLSLAIIVLPFALLSVLSLVEAVSSLFGASNRPSTLSGSSAWWVLINLVVITADVFMFGRVREATRRLKLLHENPGANVRPLPAPFQASLFGPYH